MPRSPGRTGHRYRQACKRLRKPGAVCRLCGYPIDVTLTFPHRMSWTLEHVDGNPDNNDRDNLDSAHLTCNSSEGARKGNSTRGHTVSPRTATTSRSW